MLSSHGLIVFLTGAGISAESGIPTFRGQEGYWTVGSQHYQPTEMATFMMFRRMPEEVWRWYLYRRAVCRAAQPNAGHLALLRLEAALGERFLLVTQNVDGLHLRAGNSPQRTYEVHGNIDFMRCGAACCSDKWPLPPGLEDFADKRALAPAQSALLRCPACGDWARPHVLWFDECYDEENFRFHSSRDAAHKASLLVSIGTSGNTNLPLQMGRIVANRGAALIDINPDHNPFALLARETGGRWLQSSASEGLQRLLAELPA
jgi:NAD-dependent deacetylase